MRTPDPIFLPCGDAEWLFVWAAESCHWEVDSNGGRRKHYTPELGH